MLGAAMPARKGPDPMSLSHVRTTKGGRVVRSQVTTYEERLHEDFGWACREADAHFSERSEVQITLRRLARDLDALGIPYAVVGAMAMYAHKFERFTIDVDLIVDRDGLKRLHEALDGRGYLPPFEASKNLRDTQNGVRIDLLVAGSFPGDGKEKSVAFPDPAQDVVVIDGIRYVTLPKLVELKLASGMTGARRLKDLGDVESMIHALQLPRRFGDQLDPFVRAKFDEMWLAWEADPTKDEF
jgi:hypothetical protein